MVVTAVYLAIGNSKDATVSVFSFELRTEYIFNSFLMFSITLIARKLLLAEEQWRATFEDAVADTNKSFLEEVKAAVPLSNMLFIDNEADWYSKAISMLRDPTGFTESGNIPPRTIYASTSILQISDHEILSTARLNYFKSIAEICCSTNESAPQYRLLISPGNDLDTSRELNARLDKFDSVVDRKNKGEFICKEWGGANIQIRVADIAGIDFVIYGNSVLFNLRTYKDEHRPQRKGIYVNDANIATTFRRWFQSIYDDATSSKTINQRQASNWNLDANRARKMGVEIDANYMLKNAEQVNPEISNQY